MRGVRLRRDRVDRHGKISLLYRSRLHHIGIGRAHKGKRVIMLIDDLEIRVLDEDGEVLRELVLDRSKDYQGTDRQAIPKVSRGDRVVADECPLCSDTSVHDAPTHDTAEAEGIEPTQPGEGPHRF